MKLRLVLLPLFLMTCLLIAAAHLTSVDAAPPRIRSTGMAVTYEDVNYGYEGDPYDGILGSDETLEWVAEGQLAAGQQFVYSYLPSTSGRFINVQAYPRGGQAVLQVEIEVLTQTDTGLQRDYATGTNGACLSTTWSKPWIGNWTVKVANIGNKTARGIYEHGQNMTNFGQVCPGG